MKKIVLIFLICSSLLFGFREKEWVINFVGIEKEANIYSVTAKQDILTFCMAYPEDIVDLEKNDKDEIYIMMKSGKKLLYDDKRNKTFTEKMANPDLQDVLEQIYPLGDIYELMDIDYDPGRVRHYTLLKEVYGSSKNEVESNLKRVRVGYSNQQFNSQNRAAERLEAVMDIIIPLGQQSHRISRAIYPPGGTFNYRVISGTGQLSPHAFGIAIDLAKDDRDYWQWTTREKGEERLKEYPREIVSAFEKNGFIWGGKWGHFDTLHFEYRPEIIIKSQYFSKPLGKDEPWYGRVPQDENIMKLIEKIDTKLP